MCCLRIALDFLHGLILLGGTSPAIISLKKVRQVSMISNITNRQWLANYLVKVTELQLPLLGKKVTKLQLPF